MDDLEEAEKGYQADDVFLFLPMILSNDKMQ